MKVEEMLVLNETFEIFRVYCEYLKYFQRDNSKVISLGIEGIDYGFIRCTHTKTSNVWCREDREAGTCPRLKKFTPRVS